MLKNIENDITETDITQFRKQGFWIRNESIFLNDTSDTLKTLRQQIEDVLNGKYDLETPPAKVNNPSAALAVDKNFSFATGFSSSSPKKVGKAPTARQKTIHLVNVWKSNRLLKSLVTSPPLGTAVVRLMKWESDGCRVAQDQVWIKPPFSGPLSYHRDTPYIDFDPKEVCTVWIPFDALTPDSGTLEYCAGSHRWNSTKRGSANQFYNNNYKALLVSAAEESGQSVDLNSSIYSVLPELGGCSFHDGNVWHGSDCNNSTRWRCGIGIHFVRGNATLMPNMGSLWQQLQGASNTCIPNSDSFPKIV